MQKEILETLPIEYPFLTLIYCCYCISYYDYIIIIIFCLLLFIYYLFIVFLFWWDIE